MDLAVWFVSSGAIIVDAPKSVAEQVEQVRPVLARFASAKPKVGNYLNAVRLHQWLKNLLVFVPVLASHRVSDEIVMGQVLLAFLAFSLCASSVYLLNDLLDLPSDRAHPRKRQRPFASGLIPLEQGVFLASLLLLIAVFMAWWLPGTFFMALVGYYMTTLAYSLWLKNQVIVDVLVLAILYTFRIIAGAAATEVVPSFWLLAFSMFLFLSLAMVKRYAELLVVLTQKKETMAGRGYHVNDLPLLESLGGASGYLSVLVLALYLNSSDVHTLYASPQVLWLMLPLLLFWVSRMWIKTHRGEMHDDPVVFAVKDRLSLMIGAACGLLILAAIVNWSAAV
jgi:4-hydroxybenzoate polyprenyltransferase